MTGRITLKRAAGAGRRNHVGERETLARNMWAEVEAGPVTTRHVKTGTATTTRA